MTAVAPERAPAATIEHATAGRYSRAAGVLYLVTFATSIPALMLKRPALDLQTPLTNATASAAVVGAFLEIILAIACVGTALALYPLVRAASAVPSLGLVVSRTVEATLVLAGVAALLVVIELRTAGADASASVALHDAAFLLGPGLLPAVNAALLAPALLRARLVPRAIPVLGLIGVPLLLGSAVATLVGGLEQVSASAGLLALPIAAWELALGVWLTARGASSAAALSEHPRAGRA